MDSTTHDAVVELGSAIGSAHAQPVGAYRFDVVTGTWWWSDEVYTMFGYERGDVVPSSELMLAHAHPDERKTDVLALEVLCRAGRSFSYVQRIRDAHRDVRSLAISGQGRLGESNEPVLEATGFFVDVSAVERATYQAEVSRALGGILESRASIEQAKGILMLVHGVSESATSDVLRHHASLADVTVRDLAEGLRALAQSGVLADGSARAVDAFFAEPARESASAEGLPHALPPLGFTMVASWTLHRYDDLGALRAGVAAAISSVSSRDAARRLDVERELVLISSELATNALKHGGSPAVVTLSSSATGYLLDVADPTPHVVPTLPRNRALGDGGHGLRLAVELAARIGYFTTAATKHVWVVLATDC